MAKRADQLKVGEEYEPLILHISRELNQQFMKAVDGFHPRYNEIVHPGVLLAFCSITQSPSFYLENDVAAVGAKFEANYIHPPRIGKTFIISWKVAETYERRSRTYQICDVLVKDNDGTEILHRKISNTFIGGEYLQKRVKWEKKTGYRRAVTISEFPAQGYEIVAEPKRITMEKLRYFSGGLPGIDWPARNIHTDREISIRSGIGRPIASGMMFESQLTDLMVNFFGDDWLNYGKIDVIAIDMAGDGDSVVPKAVIKIMEFNRQESKVVLDLWCENQYGNKIMVGSGTGAWKQ